MTVLECLDVSIVILSGRWSGGEVTFHQELVFIEHDCILVFKQTGEKFGQMNQASLTLSWSMNVTLSLPCCFPVQFKQVASLSLADTSCRS